MIMMIKKKKGPLAQYPPCPRSFGLVFLPFGLVFVALWTRFLTPWTRFFIHWTTCCILGQGSRGSKVQGVQRLKGSMGSRGSRGSRVQGVQGFIKGSRVQGVQGLHKQAAKPMKTLVVSMLWPPEWATQHCSKSWFSGFASLEPSPCRLVLLKNKGCTKSSKTNENTSVFNALASLSGPPQIAQNHGFVVLRLGKPSPCCIF